MGGQLRRCAVVAAVLGLSVAACSLLPSSGDASLARQRQQAQAELARWADAVKAAGGQQAFEPVGELYAQVGDWEEPVGDNNKRALMAGAIVAETPLPSETPPDAEIRWDDGATRTVHLMSAAL